MFLVYKTLNQHYQGVVVATLPFVPLAIITGFSHANLVGTDYTECSFLFLYLLCSFGLRPNVKKLLQIEEAPSLFAPDGDDE